MSGDWFPLHCALRSYGSTQPHCGECAYCLANAEIERLRAEVERLRAERAVLRADLAAVTTEYKAERRLADNLAVRLTEEASRER